MNEKPRSAITDRNEGLKSIKCMEMKQDSADRKRSFTPWHATNPSAGLTMGDNGHRTFIARRLGQGRLV